MVGWLSKLFKGSDDWLAALPERILFCDVETTGLMDNDRVVSLGIITLLSRPFTFNSHHLIFNPGQKSHPKAREVHGYDDWILQHQEDFSRYAPVLHGVFSACDLMVAHNAAFDRKFIQREFALCGQPPFATPAFCTMQAWRSANGGKSSLDAVCAHVGIGRSRESHGALEDAWLAMQIYLWMHKCPRYRLWSPALMEPRPLNFKEPPPKPERPQQRRRKRKNAEATDEMPE